MGILFSRETFIESFLESCATQTRPTMRAPDVWESARFQAVCVAWSVFRQNSVTSARPAAGNASR
jgi:hypothetical protein